MFGRGGSGEAGGICAAVNGTEPAEGSASSLRGGAAAEDEDEDDEAVVTGAGGAGKAGDCNTDRDDDDDDDDDDAFPMDRDCWYCRERLVGARDLSCWLS